MNKTNNRPVVNHPKNLSNSTESAHTPDTTPTRSSPSATGQFSYAQLAKQNLAKTASTDSKAANSHSKSNGTTPQQNTPKSSNNEAKKPEIQNSTETKPINIKNASGVKLPQFPGASTPRSNIQFGSIDQPDSGIPSPSTSPVHRNSFISQDNSFPTFGTAVKNGSIDSVSPGVRITAQKPQNNRTISQKDIDDSTQAAKDSKPQTSTNSESSPSLNTPVNQTSSTGANTNKTHPSPQSFGHPNSHYNKGTPYQPTANFPQPPPNAQYPVYNNNQQPWQQKVYPAGPGNAAPPINPNYNHPAGNNRPRDRQDQSPNSNPTAAPGGSPSVPHGHGSPAWQHSNYMYYPPGSMGYEGSAPYYMYNQGMPNQYNPPMHGANPANSSPSSAAMAQHTFNTNAPSFVPSKASKAIKIVNPVSKKVVDPAAAASSTTQSPTPDSKANEAKTADTESEKPTAESKDANNAEAQNDQKDNSDKEKQATKLEEPKVDNYIINQGVPSIPITLSYAKPGISKAIKITPPPAPVEVKPVEQPTEPAQEQPKSVESAIPNGESKAPATDDSEETISKPVSSEPEEIKPSEQTEKDVPVSAQKVAESSQVSEDQPSATDKPSSAIDSSIQSTLRYQRDFLLSFKENCTIKPTNMKPIEDIVIDSPSREGGERKPSNRRQNSSHHGKFNRGDSSGSFDFNVSKAKTTSEERFKMSTQMQNSSRHPLGQRSSSGGPGNNMDGMGHFGKETRSSRGRGGDKNRRYQQQGGPTIPLDQVVPLEKSENRWVPQTTQAKNNDIDEEEKLARQIKALLNKLTLEKFQAISDQILEIANLSISDNGLALRTVIYLIFEKATDEANFGAIYARLCQKILECLDPNVKDEDFKDKDGNHVMGGHLFRKYLLMRCQSEFEKGWRLSDEYKEKTIVDYSDEYYAAAKAKRRGLGLVRFIGELFKQNMLSSRIMNECIVKLLQSEIPEEEEIESLTKLMGTVGAMLEQREDSKQRFALYFDKIASLSKNPALPSRHRFMLKDLLDLRKDNWVPRNNTNSGPKTIAQIHQDAQKEKEQSEILKRVNSSGPRGPSLSQHGRSYSGKIDKAPRNPEGWNTISSSTTSKKIGDLTSFGNFDRSKTSNQSLGPSSNNVFDSLQNVKPAPREKEAPAKKTTLTNMFDMLNDDDSHDDGHDAKPESASKAQSEPKADEAAPSQASAGSSEKLPTSPEAIKRRVDSTINEFFNLKDFNEAKLCFKEFAEMNCTKVAIQTLIFSSLEKKAEDVELAIKLIQKLDEESIINDRKVYIEALTVVMESAEDLSYDVPQLWTLLGLILAGIPSLKFTDLSVILEPLLQSPARLPPGPKLVANYINELKKTKTEQDIINKAKEENFDISSLGPKFADHMDLKFLAKDSTTN